ncbi:MAG: cobalamin-dependent protein, partial [Acidobacteriota bacterium]
MGLANIAAVLKENRIPCRILDLCFVRDFEEAIVSEITLYQPDLIGLSLRNLDNVSYPNYTSYLPFYRKIIQIIRKKTSSRIIVGGSAFSLMPEAILSYLNADFGIAGEGERGIIALIHQINAADKKGIELKGRIIWDRDVGIVENLDDFPFPDRSGLDSEAYLQYGGMGNIQTKRGCPFNCIYCTYPIIEGKKV